MTFILHEGYAQVPRMQANQWVFGLQQMVHSTHVTNAIVAMLIDVHTGL